MSVQKFDHPSFKVLITGTSGTGKTTLFHHLLKREQASLKFVYDHQGEFGQRFKIPSVSSPDDLVEKTAKFGWVIYDPIESWPGKAPQGFDFYCEYVFQTAQASKGRKIFACDELQKLTDTSNEPEKFLTLCETGRRFQIDIIAISQAPNRLHNAIRNQLTQVYTFKQTDSNALKFLEENGFDPEAVRALTNHEYLHRDFNTGEITAGRIKI